MGKHTTIPHAPSFGRMRQRVLTDLGPGNQHLPGYYASTISPSAIGQVTDYINAQSEHHRKRPFVDELKAMGELWPLGYHPNDLL